MTQQQVGRSISWHSDIQTSPVLSELLCAIRERYIALSIEPPTFSVLGVIGNDWPSYLAVLRKVAPANTSVLNDLISQMVTAVNRLSGLYYNQDFTTIPVNITANGWNSIHELQSALTSMCMLPVIVRNIDVTYNSVTTPVCGARSASFLLPRDTDAGPIVSYSFTGTSTVTPLP